MASIVKRCRYRGDCFNLLPAVLITPLYQGMTHPRSMVAPPVWRFAVPKNNVDSERPVNTGYRVAFKLGWWHYGIEVHYDTTAIARRAR